ncbi:MAG: type II toxin-antitoxin system VapC family toxin [Treponematales bacterium]
MILDAASPILSERGEWAFAVLNDARRELLTSDYVWLETVLKMEYHKMTEQVRYVEVFLSHAECVASSAAIISEAKRLAMAYGLSAMDALHAASAIAGGAMGLIPGRSTFT